MQENINNTPTLSFEERQEADDEKDTKENLEKKSTKELAQIIKEAEDSTDILEKQRGTELWDARLDGQRLEQNELNIRIGNEILSSREGSPSDTE